MLRKIYFLAIDARKTIHLQKNERRSYSVFRPAKKDRSPKCMTGHLKSAGLYCRKYA